MRIGSLIIAAGTLSLANCDKVEPPSAHTAEEPRRRVSPPSAVMTHARQPSGINARLDPELERLAYAAFEEADAEKSEDAFWELIQKLKPDNAAQLRTIIAAIKPIGDQEQRKRHGRMRQQFDFHWGAIDGSGAISYGFDQWAGEKLTLFMREILPGWASGDPESAIAWAEGPGPDALDELNRSKMDDYSFGRFGGAGTPRFLAGSSAA